MHDFTFTLHRLILPYKASDGLFFNFGWKESMFICQPENQSVPQESKIWKLKASLQLAMASIRLEQESNQQWGCKDVSWFVNAVCVPCSIIVWGY